MAGVPANWRSFISFAGDYEIIPNQITNSLPMVCHMMHRFYSVAEIANYLQSASTLIFSYQHWKLRMAKCMRKTK